MATNISGDTVETFVECPVCNGWYASLEVHLKCWRKYSSSRKGYSNDFTIQEDSRHEELFAETFVRIVPQARSNRKYASLAEKQRAYYKHRSIREETPTVLSCGHSTVAWTTDEVPMPICSTCGIEPQ